MGANHRPPTTQRGSHSSAQRRYDGCHRVDPSRQSRDCGGSTRTPRVPRRGHRSRRVRVLFGRPGVIIRQARRETRGRGWRRRAPGTRVPPDPRAPRPRPRTHLSGTSCIVEPIERTPTRNPSKDHADDARASLSVSPDDRSRARCACAFAVREKGHSRARASKKKEPSD